MADLTDRDVRQIVDNALTDVRSSLNAILNAIRDTRSDISGFVPPLTPINNIHTNITNLRGTVDTIKNDSSRIQDIINALNTANANFNVLQQSLVRIETNVQTSANLMSHLQQVRQDVLGLQQVISNLEQFMGDMSQYLQSLHDRVGQMAEAHQQPPQQQPS